MSDFQEQGLQGQEVDTPTTEPNVADNTDEFDWDVDLDMDTTDDSEQEPQKPTSDVQNTIKVKYNHEERELSYDEAVELAQKGMNYEKAIERAAQEAEQKALDNYIAQQGFEDWQGRPITTYAEYQQALEVQDLIEQYQTDNIPEPIIEELLENRKFREQFMAQQEQQAAEEAENEQFLEFADEFPDVDPESIPQEVWVKFSEGVPLKYAYMEHEMQRLRSLANIQQQNQKNQTKPNLGVTSYGSGEPEKSEDPFLAGFNS